MEAWLRISLLLCSFGFFREMRPSDPYNIEYMTVQFNSTSTEINKDVYPVGTYSQLAQLVVIFLVTDILRYKPIIIVAAFAGLAVYGVDIWCTDLFLLKLGQIFYGTLMACEVAYYTYIYAKVDRERYQIVTGHTRAAILCGKFLGGVLGQLLLSTGAMSMRSLYFITFSSQVVSLIIAVCLPRVSKSLYFYADKVTIMEESAKRERRGVAIIDIGSSLMTAEPLKIEAPPKSAKPQFSWNNASQLLLTQIKSAYTKPIVIQWSIWWALATSAQVQIISYIQFLWMEIDPEHENFYNGAAEASITLLGATAAMAAGVINGSRHKKWHWWIITICSLIMGAFIIIAAVTTSVITCYILYVLFGVIYFFVITIASATVAENLSDDSFGLIFGINALFALMLQSLLTVLVISDTGLSYGPREQYVVYGGCFVVLSGLYLIAAVVKTVMKCYREQKSHPIDVNE